MLVPAGKCFTVGIRAERIGPSIAAGNLRMYDSCRIASHRASVRDGRRRGNTADGIAVRCEKVKPVRVVLFRNIWYRYIAVAILGGGRSELRTGKFGTARFGTGFRVKVVANSFGITATVFLLLDASTYALHADEMKEIAYPVKVPVAARNVLRVFGASEVLGVGEKFGFNRKLVIVSAYRWWWWCQHHRCTTVFLWERNLLAAN